MCFRLSNVPCNQWGFTMHADVSLPPARKTSHVRLAPTGVCEGQTWYQACNGVLLGAEGARGRQGGAQDLPRFRLDIGLHVALRLPDRTAVRLASPHHVGG